MKGLLIKDLSYLKVSNIIVIVLGIAALFAFTGSGFAMTYLAVMSASLVQTTFSYDDFQGGTRFLLTLPITREMYVRSKYLFALLMSGSCMVLACLLGWLRGALYGGADGADLAVNAGIGLMTACIMASVSIPVLIRFGVEKGRFVSIGLYLLVFLAVMGLGFAGKGLFTPVEVTGGAALFLACLAAAAVPMGISYAVSLRIIRKKDY